MVAAKQPSLFLALVETLVVANSRCRAQDSVNAYEKRPTTYIGGLGGRFKSGSQHNLLSLASKLAKIRQAFDDDIRSWSRSGPSSFLKTLFSVSASSMQKFLPRSLAAGPM